MARSPISSWPTSRRASSSSIPRRCNALDSRPLQVRRLGLVPYADGLELQRQLVEERKADRIPDTLLLLQHPHVLTIGVKKDGRSHILASPERLSALGVEVFETGRGGDVTYHGPGQLVGYPIVDLNPDRRDVHQYVRDLEEVMIARVRGLRSRRRPRRRDSAAPGCRLLEREEKIGAIGVRISRWITSHGFAFNVATDIDFFNLIVPCGIADRGVTSLAAQARPRAGDGRGRRPLRRALRGVFGRTTQISNQAALAAWNKGRVRAGFLFPKDGCHSMRDQNECALVERLRSQDETALAELSSLYGARIFQLAFRYMRNHEDAEEVVQDVLLKVFRKIEMFRGDSALSSWIYRITFNTAMSRLRRTKATRMAEVTELEIGTSLNDDGAERATTPRTGRTWPTRKCCAASCASGVVAAVGELPAIYREPVILRDLRGLVDGRSEHAAAGQGSDAQVTAASRPDAVARGAADFADGLSMQQPGARRSSRSLRHSRRIAVSKRTRSRDDSEGATRVAIPVGCSVTGIIADRPGDPSSRVTATSAVCTRGVRVSAVRISRVAALASV